MADLSKVMEFKQLGDQRMHRLALVLLCVSILGPMAEARVEYVEVLRREPFSFGETPTPQAAKATDLSVGGSDKAMATIVAAQRPKS
jgi:hypothetical protein